MDEIDRMLMDETPSSSSDFFDKPSVETSNFVVIDEKTFNDGFLFHAISKGNTTLSLKHGKGINITKFKGKGGKDWVTLQIIDAGCGKQVRKQTADYSSKPKTTKKTFAPGTGGKKLAW